MRDPARGLDPRGKVQKLRVLRERSVLDGQINRPQIHGHDAARSDIGMADLGIAHLPARQADIGAKGGQRRVRAFGPYPVEMRHLCLHGGGVLRVFPQTPAIQNAQNNRFFCAHRIAP